MAKEKEIGKVTHYFTKIGVAGIDLTDNLNAGDNIHVKGHTSDFTQSVDSMQIDNESVEKAGKGDSIGLKVPEHAREGDTVYKESE